MMGLYVREDCEQDVLSENFVLGNDYPFLIRDLLVYMEEVLFKYDCSLLEIIEQFATKKELDIRQVGDAISEDEYLKAYIKKDCEVRGIIKSDYQAQEDW